MTGGSGHLGVNLVRELLRVGRAVRVVTRTFNPDADPLSGLDVERVLADVSDNETLERALKGAETVFHLAAKVSIVARDRDVHRVNVRGTENVAGLCLRLGVRRLVHVSSIEAFDPYPFDVPVTEARRLRRPSSRKTYGLSKADGQRAVVRACGLGLDAVIVNPTGILGPQDVRPSRMGRVLRSIFRSRLPLIVGGGFNWVDVRDVVTGALAAERHGVAGESYILAGTWVSFRELAAEAAQIACARPPYGAVQVELARVMAPPAELLQRALRIDPTFTTAAVRALTQYRFVDDSCARQTLNYRSRALHETLSDTWRWLALRGAGAMTGRT